MAWLDIPRAIIVGAAIIGGCMLLAEILAPYRMAAAPGTAWRINTITGAVMLCQSGIDANAPDAGNRCR